MSVVAADAAADGITLRASLRSDALQGKTAIVLDTESHRLMLSDGVVIGAEHRHETGARHQIAFSGMALMATVAFLLPTPRTCLCLGLGAGTVPQFLRAEGIRTDAVEHDPAVIRLAEQHFLFGEGPEDKGSVVQADALELVLRSGAFVHAAARRYDVIISDLWSGSNEGRALSLPFFSAIKAHWLTPKGALGVNLIAYADGPHSALAVRVVATLRACFAHVRVFSEYAPGDEAPDEAARSGAGQWDAYGQSLARKPGNLLLLGSDAPLEFVSRHFVDEAGLLANEGSMHHLFNSFHDWQPPRLLAAAAGRDGEPIESAADWRSLEEESAATYEAMRAEQRDLLPTSGWRLVEDTMHDAEEMPPRHIAPSPARMHFDEEATAMVDHDEHMGEHQQVQEQQHAREDSCDSELTS